MTQDPAVIAISLTANTGKYIKNANMQIIILMSNNVHRAALSRSLFLDEIFLSKAIIR
jgi:hypothetical protein